ncbi:MAG: FadR family transcriptional regulator [Desulfarculaceae bacterium]|nr:FadR family transcriptional regulator [Desulfarculaceae bacterium]
MVQGRDAINELKAVKKKSLHELIVQQIQGLIDGGKLKAGDRLPTERELAEVFKVSRHTVREAIRTLEEKKILRSRVGSGTYVVLGEEQALSEVLAGFIAGERGKLAEIFEFRRLVEPQIASLAAQNATAEDIEALESIVAEQRARALKNDASRWGELDARFHRLVAQATGNSVLIKVVAAFDDILEVCREDVYLSRDRLRHSAKGHAALVKAIKGHSPSEAVQAMTDHLRFIEKLISDQIGA